jgi:hypothetical protein
MSTNSTELYKIATGIVETSTSESAWIVVLLIGFVLVSNIFLIIQWKDSKLSKTQNSNARLTVKTDVSQMNSTLLNRPSSLLLKNLSLHHTKLNKEHSSRL